MGGHETQGTGASQVAQHRLAGGQALVGIGPPQDLVHKAEELLARVRTLQNAPQAAQLGNKITLPRQQVIGDGHAGQHGQGPGLQGKTPGCAKAQRLSQQGVQCQGFKKGGFARSVAAREQRAAAEGAAVGHGLGQQGMPHLLGLQTVFRQKVRRTHGPGLSGGKGSGTGGQLHFAQQAEQLFQRRGLGGQGPHRTLIIQNRQQEHHIEHVDQKVGTRDLRAGLAGAHQPG